MLGFFENFGVEEARENLENERVGTLEMGLVLLGTNLFDNGKQFAALEAEVMLRTDQNGD